MRATAILALAVGALFALAAPACAATTWIDWTAAKNGAHHTYYVGALTLTLASKKVEGQGDDLVPVLHVAGPDGAVDLVAEDASGPAAALVGVVNLDLANPAPQVIFMTYTGGAHCCTVVRLAVPHPGGWRSFSLEYDGEPAKQILQTVAGNPTIVVEDMAFDYAFASHAGSYLPSRLYQVHDGGLFDVSGEKRFQAFYRRQLAEPLKGCHGEVERNGACAAYVALASLAGMRDAGWAEMMRSFDPKSSPGSDGCKIDLGDQECPADKKITFADLPHALRWFLWRNGYDPVAPGFACEQAGCGVKIPETPAP